MRQLIVKQLDYDLTPVAGLALVGQYLKAVQPVLGRLDAALPVKGGVANSDIVRSMPIRLTPKTTTGSVRAWRSIFRRACLNFSGCFPMSEPVVPTWSKCDGRMALRARGAARRVRRTGLRADRRSCGAATASETPTSQRGPSCTRPAYHCRSGSGRRIW